ncbi:MAG: serine hydrolase [Clostridia bacterium]|nr:serine hydrolase [Clostridia bacterium]
MFEKITPEQAGISSRQVSKFLSRCHRNGLTMHSVLMMKGDKLFAECYWAPFDKDFNHRMYSQTKSYVAVAIGLLEEEGKLSLDAPVATFFPEKIERELPRFLAEQTVREMLTMTTCGSTAGWFRMRREEPDNPLYIDRTKLYFATSNANRPAGTVWEYDSPGSQVLCALVEKLSGMSLFDYLNEKIFKHLGTFKNATILKTSNGDSWGDSALVCTSRDMMSFGRFVMNYGMWNGKRLMNEAYLRAATAKQVSNNVSGFELYNSHGYGYQIWRTEQNGFAFHGMGGQFTICLPDKDFIFVCTGDNQGYDKYQQALFSALFEEIVDYLDDTPLPEDPAAFEALVKGTASLTLRAVNGETSVPLAKEINGVRYDCYETPNLPKIKWFSLHFYEDKPCEFRYENRQGEKTVYFGMGKNAFGKFPQLGYSNDYGTVRTTDGFMYDCAASAAWVDPARLLMRVQIIDRYFGNMFAHFAFKGDEVSVLFTAHAEDFLGEYKGRITAKKAE